MEVPQLLLKTLEDLDNEDFEKFKWYLSMEVLDGCKPIPKSRLAKASRIETVTRLRESYGDESAVRVTALVLKQMDFNNNAQELKNMYPGAFDGGEPEAAAAATASSASTPAAPAAPAAPVTMSADHGGIVVAPMVTGDNRGQVNITFNK
ncbi:hypothetical protein JOB18_042957 [Solea senegalensis]|uniref:Pyrin domain-containing protein n=1 Tax=Solea senegalensis TaxID=28829 RepID=A0AAV6QBG0_SOLSE|nr:hypothetical protein JOB18_042957 [Solea senegalensis]KAG7486955.1 hypothetical protein JOB18_042957 [Solea senegalensis]